MTSANGKQRFGASNGRLREPPEFNNPVSPALRELGDAIRKYAKDLKREEEAIELTAQADRCQALAAALESWLTQSEKQSVYWVETTDRARQNIKLVCAPIDLGPILREELFNQVPTAILTSATLAVGRQDFHFIQEPIGFDVRRGDEARQPVRLQNPDAADPARRHARSLREPRRV